MNEFRILYCDSSSCPVFMKLCSRQDHRSVKRIGDKFIGVELQKAGVGHFLPSESDVCNLLYLLF